ncbi:hypothetical protein NECID01_0670 [Nematocida sp. AWRm77]|nr:hypothetical protein NECID01_0670 [Nematocida sp. AWRm77]
MFFEVVRLSVREKNVWTHTPSTLFFSVLLECSLGRVCAVFRYFGEEEKVFSLSLLNTRCTLYLTAIRMSHPSKTVQVELPSPAQAECMYRTLLSLQSSFLPPPTLLLPPLSLSTRHTCLCGMLLLLCSVDLEPEKKPVV